jgi:hypothetical protein
MMLGRSVTLAYIGLPGVGEREEGLRTQYLATATLARDRLATELTTREDMLAYPDWCRRAPS